MSASNNHATLLAHLYALSDMIHEPQRILSGDYELVQVLANNDETTQFNFYLREPKTQFFISADPHVFAVGDLDKLCDMHPIDVFQRLAKICSLRLLATEGVNGWPFNDGLTTRTFSTMFDISRMLLADAKRTEVADENDVLRQAFEANPYHEIYLCKPGIDQGLVDLLKSNKSARYSIRSALRLVKHNAVRKELTKSFACILE